MFVYSFIVGDCFHQNTNSNPKCVTLCRSAEVDCDRVKAAVCVSHQVSMSGKWNRCVLLQYKWGAAGLLQHSSCFTRQIWICSIQRRFVPFSKCSAGLCWSACFSVCAVQAPRSAAGGWIINSNSTVKTLWIYWTRWWVNFFGCCLKVEIIFAERVYSLFTSTHDVCVCDAG